MIDQASFVGSNVNEVNRGAQRRNKRVWGAEGAAPQSTGLSRGSPVGTNFAAGKVASPIKIAWRTNRNGLYDKANLAFPPKMELLPAKRVAGWSGYKVDKRVSTL